MPTKIDNTVDWTDSVQNIFTANRGTGGDVKIFLKYYETTFTTKVHGLYMNLDAKTEIQNPEGSWVHAAIYKDSTWAIKFGVGGSFQSAGGTLATGACDTNGNGCDVGTYEFGCLNDPTP